MVNPAKTQMRGENGNMGRLEQLKADLAAGKITLEQYKAQAKAILAEELTAGRIVQADHDAKAAEIDAETGSGAGGGAGGSLTKEQIDQMIAEAVTKAEQSAADRVRTQATKEKKELQDKLDELSKAKMSEEEKAKFERDKMTKQLADKEAELLQREVRLHTVDKLRELNLPVDFRDILAGLTVDDTNTRITAFQAQWQTALKAAVDERFKAGGGTPPGGGAGAGGGAGGEANPWDPKTLNLTKQGQLINSDREKARRMAAAHGVTLNF